MKNKKVNRKPGVKANSSLFLALSIFMSGNLLGQSAAKAAEGSDADQLVGAFTNAVNAQNIPSPSSMPSYMRKRIVEAPTTTPPATAIGAGNLLKATVSQQTLEGRVTEEGALSPLLEGSVQSIPQGTAIQMKMCSAINTQLCQKGDEIYAQVSSNVGDGAHVMVPGGWFAHGLVSDVAGQKRGGRDGYVEITFDKLVSPDKKTELPFNSKFTTRDNKLKAVSKTVLVDSGYVSYGALGGAIMSVQMTGIPTAIATHGISVGVGAGIGASIGLAGALARKGKIVSYFPEDEIKLVTAEPISLPGFNPTALPSAEIHQHTEGLNLAAKQPIFQKDKFGDKASRILSFDATIYNGTPEEYGFFHLAVVSDHNQRYCPLISSFNQAGEKVQPHSSGSKRLAFLVGNPKQKYYLVLFDSSNEKEIARTAIN